MLVNAYSKRIFNMAFQFSGTYEEAEDMTQEIFMKVYRTLHTYRPESGALLTWMIRVGRNHIIDHYRKYRTERAHTDSLEVEFERAEENPARYPSPGEALEKRELSEQIHRALLKISQELREAVILRDLEEFTYEEIANMLGVPIGTVKSRINRGRTELARVLRRKV